MNIGEGSGEGGHQITPGSRLADDGKRLSGDGRCSITLLLGKKVERGGSLREGGCLIPPYK